MADEFEKVERAVERIETGIADLREKNAGREVWEKGTDKRLDHIYDKKLPSIDGRLEKVENFQIDQGAETIKNMENRIRSNEDFKGNMKVYGAIFALLWPLLAAYILKTVLGG